MLPYLAQGANSSLEDGAVLGLLLGHMTDKAQLPRILRLYETLRKSRGEAIVRETFKQVSLFSLKTLVISNKIIHRDTTSICRMVKSRRIVMRFSSRSLARSSREPSPVDGEALNPVHTVQF
jgi:salicylate hydroxylase